MNGECVSSRNIGVNSGCCQLDDPVTMIRTMREEDIQSIPVECNPAPKEVISHGVNPNSCRSLNCPGNAYGLAPCDTGFKRDQHRRESPRLA